MNRWNSERLNEQIYELEFAPMTEWQIHFHAFFFRNYCTLQLGNSGHGLKFRMVTAWLYFPCWDSRYSPQAQLQVERWIMKRRGGEFSVGFTPTTVGRWECLEHHMGHAGFPSFHCRGVMCVEAILDCTQTASSDWWTQGMFTPAQQNKHFFFSFLETSPVQLWEIMWGVNRSQSLKWDIVNWHSALEWKSNFMLM